MKKADIRLIFDLVVEADEEDFDSNDPRDWAILLAKFFKENAVISIIDSDEHGEIELYSDGDNTQLFAPENVRVKLDRIYTEDE